jgi:glucose/arabinose dehydrogenase
MLKMRTRLILAAMLACGMVLDLHAQLRTRVQASGFTLPVAFVQDPTDRRVQFIVQQNGHIRVVREGSVLAADFLDLSPATVAQGEQGLFALAFQPNIATRFFVNFTNRSGDTVVSRFQRAADPVVAEATSRFDLRWGGANGPTVIAQPFDNHNGGHLAFGPDGYLYIGMGDGGSGDDPGNRAQDGSELLGKMLRIDVNVGDSHASGYEIPPDNPFRGGSVAARPEIWAFGLRNPWRYSFDDPARGGTGGLIIADVGQNRFEEIDYEPAGRGGRNYGWRNREGMHDNVTTLPAAFQPLTEPIYEYDHSAGQSITGGFLYRGRALPPAYQGRYFFADYVRGRVWSIAIAVDASGDARASNPIEHTAELGGASVLGNVSSFGLDADGELHIVSYSNGRVLKVIGPPAAPPAPSGLRIIR